MKNFHYLTLTAPCLLKLVLLLSSIVMPTAIARGQVAWQPANGDLMGGVVTTFAFDSSSHANVYAGSRCDLFRFDRQSNRWVVEVPQLPTDIMVATGSGALILRNDSSIVRIASPGALPERVDMPGAIKSITMGSTGTLLAVVLPRYLMRSADDGRTWQVADSTILATHPHGQLLASDQGVFIAFGNGKPIRSIDDGRTWEVPGGAGARSFRSLISTGGGTVFALVVKNGNDSLFFSTDNGDSWALISAPGHQYGSNWGVGPDRSFYTLRFNADQFRIPHLYRSTDNGATWQDLGVNLADRIAIAPSGEFWTSERGRIKYSNDGGRTWEDRTQGFNALLVPEIQIDPSGRIYAIVGMESTSNSTGPQLYGGIVWGGLFRSLDGGQSWRLMLNNPGWFRGTVNNDIVMVSTGTTVKYSRDNGETWDSIASPGRQYNGVYNNADGRIVVLFQGNSGEGRGTEMVISSDHGQTWSRSIHAELYAPAFVGASGRILAGRGDEDQHGRDMVSSTDDGATWEVAIPGFSVRDISRNERTGELYAVGYPPRDVPYAIYRSLDNGASWELRHDFLPHEPRYGFIEITRRGDILLEGTNYSSRDSGTTWESRPGDMWYDDLISSPDGTFYSFRPAVGKGVLTYLSTMVTPEIHRSTDFGDTWSRIEGPVAIHGTMAIAFAPDGQMFVGTNGCGIYTDRGSSRVAARAATPAGITIHAVEPNPTSGRTLARISIATRQEIMVTLSDLSGRQIALLHRGVVDAGTTDVALDASTVGAGTYIISLHGADGVVSRRVVVLR